MMNTVIKQLLLALTVLVFFSPQIHAAEIKVYAAASLTNVLQEITKDYEAQSGDKILFNFAGSNVLARQIVQGAPADLFLSADEAQMDVVAKAGLISEGTRQSLLSNSLVIVVPRESPITALTCNDLVKSDIKKIALADPRTVPAGVYAQADLAKLGVWDQVKEKVISTENVRAALATVVSGNSDVGIVYKTDALSSKGVKVVGEVSAVDGPRISYPVALLKNSVGSAEAEKFLTYLVSPAAGEVFRKYGFITKG